MKAFRSVILRQAYGNAFKLHHVDEALGYVTVISGVSTTIPEKTIVSEQRIPEVVLGHSVTLLWEKTFANIALVGLFLSFSISSGEQHYLSHEGRNAEKAQENSHNP